MTGRGIGEVQRDRIEDRDERGDDTIGLLGMQRAIGCVENLDRIGKDLRRSA